MSTVKSTYRIGWVVDSAPQRVFSFPWQKLGPVSQIRYANVARHIGETDSRFQVERYLPWKTYDIVVIIKKLNHACVALVPQLQAKGTRVIFDSNVNYYEEWGQFDIPGTRPTTEQRSLAKLMTESVDVVVADSSYLKSHCQALNPSTVMIPDAVDTDLYTPPETPKSSSGPLCLIWSGISKKAHHLELIESVLKDFKDKIALSLVINRPHPADPPSPVIKRLQDTIGAQVSYYDYHSYVRVLQKSDVIISPKILSSSYEMAHTEYKITTGMAVGLPAIASPQASYLEAVGRDEGGWICQTGEDWKLLLARLVDAKQECTGKGKQARQRVIERYSVPVIAEAYKNVLDLALAKKAPR